MGGACPKSNASRATGAAQQRDSIPIATGVKPFNDLAGKKFGYLRVVAYAGTDRHGRRRWRVFCERCAYGVKVVLAANLLSGRTKTCGCAGRQKARQRLSALARIEKFFNSLYPDAMEGWAGDAAAALTAKLTIQGLKGEPARRQFEADMRAMEKLTTAKK